jgi:FixJ family two-component response regulator
MVAPVICVIDDEESVRRALKRLLRSEGLGVRVFDSAEEFLNSDRDQACILVLDIRMPGMSGLELQERLAEEGFTRPIIFITAHDDEETRTAALEGGASAFLVKPFEGNALLAAIRDAAREMA